MHTSACLTFVEKPLKISSHTSFSMWYLDALGSVLWIKGCVHYHYLHTRSCFIKINSWWHKLSTWVTSTITRQICKCTKISIIKLLFGSNVLQIALALRLFLPPEVLSSQRNEIKLWFIFFLMLKCMKKLVTASIDDTCSIDNFIERKIQHGQWSLWALSFCNEVNNQSQGFLKMFIIDCFVLRNSTKVFSAWCKIFMPDTKWYLSQFFHTLESKMPIFFFWEKTFFCSWHTAGRKLGHFNHLNLIM